ncbi:SUN domain-containing protein 2-like, partial [Neolamprologus brichardi]|uniref:SUN domain-containing protein 2-like n=1 Tax=Neolamprologus brichardi TaxID=32507 RepID=UPI001643827F
YISYYILLKWFCSFIRSGYLNCNIFRLCFHKGPRLFLFLLIFHACLLSSTYSSSDSEKEQQVASFLRARVMSRRSLRLDEGLLDRSLPRGSASFSAGGGDWRSGRSVWTSAEGGAADTYQPEQRLIALRHLGRRCSLTRCGLALPDVLQLWLDSCWLRVRRAAACCASALTHTWQVCRGLKVNIQSDNGHRGTDRLHLCTFLLHTLVHLTPPRQTSLTAQSVLWTCSRCASFQISKWAAPLHFGCFPGKMQICPPAARSEHSGLGSEVDGGDPLRSVSPDSVSSVSVRPGGATSLTEASQREQQPDASLCRTAGDAFRWLHTRWCHMTTNTPLSWFPVLLVLLSLLFLLFGLRWFGPAVLQLLLPAVNITELRPAVSNVPALSSDSFLSSESQSGEGDVDESKEAGLLHSKPPPAETAAGEEVRPRHRRQRLSEVQWRREAAGSLLSPSPTTLPAAVSVDRQSHDALLAEVVRLEAALGDVRRDVELLSRCQDGCQQLATIQQAILGQVSAQVREEVRALLFSNQLTAGGAALPESLLQWLSERCVSETDLQAALASLELSILQNVSLQLEQRRGEDTVGEPVLHAAEGVGATVTQEDVRAAVTNALRLFSEDRTGLADYALESGGGSILSTRCSETYETKAALLSLFGVPLWYFSQSPRAVIQPDVHPGNCWAFRGATGFLVIRLSMRVLPSAFTLEHIPKALAPSGTLHSAPRDFAVYGLANESRERGKLLGTYTYDQDGDALQTFAVSVSRGAGLVLLSVTVV